MHAGEKRAHLWKNSQRLHKGLTDLGFRLGTETPQSAIIAVILTDRSEEHTSELQSLMRSSYAVFCLKKKTIKNLKQQTYKRHIQYINAITTSRILTTTI